MLVRRINTITALVIPLFCFFFFSDFFFNLLFGEWSRISAHSKITKKGQWILMSLDMVKNSEDCKGMDANLSTVSN